jgi:hypothetical protein
MKRFYSLLTFFFLLISVAHAQNAKLTGRITETGTNGPAPDVQVQVKDTKIATLTDQEGFFEIKSIPFGKQVLVITGDDYESYELNVEVNSLIMDLPPVLLKRKTIEKEGITEVSDVSLDLEEENVYQGPSALLHASEDVFVQTSGYVFGSMYFRPRGYDSENGVVQINGTDVSDPENGRVNWSDWGGLNDATRNKENYYALAPTPSSFSNIGGLTYINTKASTFRKQVKLTYSLSNRTYQNRLMFTYSPGQLKHGWSIAVSGSRRWSQRGYVPGVFYDTWAYFLAVEKKINQRHSLALTVFGSPTQRGQQAATVEEAYGLANSNYYNPNWGYQDGEQRNAKVKGLHEPYFILNHTWKINDKTSLNTSASYRFGNDTWTSLNWYNAPDPRPDYYRYLPSYQTDPTVQNQIWAQWQDDPNVSQLDWNNLYQVNYLNALVGQQTSYIVEKNVTKDNQFYFNSVLNKEINPNFTFNGGLNFRIYSAEHYKVIEDMLGGNYWVDIDQYAQRDFPGNDSIAQNDLNNPNRVCYQGDKFGYDYIARVNNTNLWGQGNFTYDKIDFNVAASISYNNMWRDGKMKNGRAPDNSYGKSKVYDFFNFGIKAGATYKITGRHFATINAFYQTQAPYFTNSFLSPKTRDDVVSNLTSEKMFGGDISYIMRYPWLNLRATYFYTKFMDGTSVVSFYHDDFQTYVNYALTGIDEYHQGLEFGGEIKATKTLSFIAVAAIGDYRYTNRPLSTVSADNGSFPDTSSITYLKNFYVAGSPQTSLCAGLKYNYKFWYLDVDASYYDQNWLALNPERRTEQAISNLGPGDPLIAQITEQQQMKGGFTLDASLGKSFKIKKKVFLNVNLSVTNILDNKNIQNRGYEQYRFDFATKDVNKYPPKYLYYYGRTFFLNISIRI